MGFIGHAVLKYHQIHHPSLIFVSVLWATHQDPKEKLIDCGEFLEEIMLSPRYSFHLRKSVTGSNKKITWASFQFTLEITHGSVENTNIQPTMDIAKAFAYMLIQSKWQLTLFFENMLNVQRAAQII